MATSIINKTEAFSNTEAVSSFPYTPGHSGVLVICFISSSSSAVWRSARITDQTANKHFDFGVYFATTYSGTSISMPVIKGHTYAIATGSEYIYLGDGARTYLVY